MQEQKRARHLLYNAWDAGSAKTIALAARRQSVPSTHLSIQVALVRWTADTQRKHAQPLPEKILTDLIGKTEEECLTLVFIDRGA